VPRVTRNHRNDRIREPAIVTIILNDDGWSILAARPIDERD
jgi:hypothetical protein